MTAIMMGATGSAAVTLPALDTVVTVGVDVWFDLGTEDTFLAYGYNDALSDPLNLNTIGGIIEDEYVDGSAITRTISHITYSEPTGGANPTLDDSIFFGLVGTSIPDTDATFREIEYNGQTYIRADADDYEPSEGGVVTYWQWNNVNPNGPGGGAAVFKVIL